MLNTPSATSTSDSVQVAVPPPTPMTQQHHTPTQPENDVVSEFHFQGEDIALTHPPSTRILFFTRNYQFAYVADPCLRKEIEATTTFDNRKWQYEIGSYVFRLADLTYLLHRICEHPEATCVSYQDDRERLFNMLSDELDRMNSSYLQIELSLSRDATGPTEWLEYFYWCHVIDHLQPFKAVVARIDAFGRVSPMGEPKSARIYGARLVSGGLMLSCGWRWGADTVFIADIQNLNAYGIYFSDERMSLSPLLKGWSARFVHTTAPIDVNDCYWGVGVEQN